MPINIITPASRGLSLALARTLLQRSPHPLIATARNDLEGTKKLILAHLRIPESQLTMLRVDVTNEPSLAAAAAKIASLFPGKKAQYIFSTAGILYPERSPAQLDAEHIRHTLDVNLLGPMLVMKHFHPFLIPDKKSTPEPQHPSVWVNMSARVGSIGDNVSGGWYSYRASKAGLNAATKSFDLFLQQRCGAAAMAVSMHPGTVRTGLSKEFWDHVPKEKLFEPEDAAGKVVGVVQAMRKEQRGKFWDWKGENIEW